MPVRRGGSRAPRPARGADRDGLARLPAGRRSGPALRLPGRRAVRTGRGAEAQPEQAARRPVRPGPAGGPRPGRGRLRSRPGPARAAGPPRQRAVRAPLGGRRQCVPLGRRPAPSHAVAGDGRLRAARQGLHRPPPGRAGAPARDLRRARAPGRRRAPAGARRHGGGAAAGAPLRQRAAPAAAGAHELLGLQHRRLLRPARGVLLERDARRAGARVQGDGAGAALGGARGAARRRLQPLRRGRRARTDPRVPGPGQPWLLPAADGGPAPLLGRDGLRQHAGPPPAPRAADGHRLTALLGLGDARRRLPLRPRPGHGAR